MGLLAWRLEVAADVRELVAFAGVGIGALMVTGVTVCTSVVAPERVSDASGSE